MDKARTAIQPDGLRYETHAYSAAIKAGGWVFVSGQLASDGVNGIPAEAGGLAPNPFLRDSMELQSRYLLDRIQHVLAAAGCDIGQDVVRIYQWFGNQYPTMEEIADGNLWPRLSITPYLDTRNEFIEPPRPASTGMVGRRLLVPGAEVLVDLIAMDSQGGALTSVETGAPEHVPSPLAGYSPAITHGDWVFLSGEMTGDWQGDYMSEKHMGPLSSLAPEARINPYYWYGSNIETQTEYALWKQREIAEAAGTSLDNAVKATVYIGHPDDYHGMDKVWRRWFPENPPARVVIPYMGLGGMGCRVEIAFKLLTGDSELVAEPVTADGVPRPFPWEPHAVRCGDFLFLSTQLPADGAGAMPPDARPSAAFPFHSNPVERAAEYLFDQIEGICEAGGTTIANVCRMQLFLESLREFPAFLAAWSRRFPEDPPALTVVEAGGSMHVPEAPLLADVIAYAP